MADPQTFVDPEEKENLTLSQTTNFRLFNLKEFADTIFRYDENIGKFSEKIENNVGKEEIAPYEQLLLFLHVFKRFILQTCRNQGLFVKGLIAV